MSDAHDGTAFAARNAVPPAPARADFGQIVLVLQGGGALGAYQAGVYQALHEAGLTPDWVIGTSIGAINAALIVGNAPENRLDRLRAFWTRVARPPLANWLALMPWYGQAAANALTVAQGLPGFFEPNLSALFGPDTPLDPEAAGYYSMAPLEHTLAELVDATWLSSGRTRLTVGAARVSTGEMRYFDSRDEPISLRHVLASGALPPAFPAVRIDGELYWDGGVLSNTPVEAVFDDNPRRSAIVFSVHIWNPQGAEPRSIYEVISRQKDIQYASRAVNHIARQKQLHKLRHVVAELARKLPSNIANDPAVRELAAYGCTTRMHVVRLLAPPLAGEDHSKDIDFDSANIERRWQAGHADTARAAAQQPWTGVFDPSDGLILHEVAAGAMIRQGG